MQNITLAILVVATGTASEYAPGIMDSVIKVRQSGRTAYDLPEKIPEVNGYVAVQDRELIGTIIYLRPVGFSEWETFLVTDCAGIADGGYAWMVRNNILVEVDYETAERWNTVGRGIKVEWGEIYLRDILGDYHGSIGYYREILRNERVKMAHSRRGSDVGNDRGSGSLRSIVSKEGRLDPQ